MKFGRIPGTELNVSALCLGTMTFGSPMNEADSIALVHHAIDNGVNFMDTANMYEGYGRFIGSAGGVAEEILGKAIKGRRDRVVVATKLGMKVGDTPEDEHTSPAAIAKQLDRSLARLDIDYIDLYYLHRPDPVTPVEEIVAALGKAIESGKIRHYGISNYSAEQLHNLLKAADDQGLPRPVISQPALSLLNKEALEGHIPLCEREGIAVAPYRVIEGGLLTGKYSRNGSVPANSRIHEKPQWMPALNDETYDRLEEIERAAQSAGLSMMQYAFKWTLEQPAVVSAIIGVKRAEQLDDMIKAVE